MVMPALPHPAMQELDIVDIVDIAAVLSSSGSFCVFFACFLGDKNHFNKGISRKKLKSMQEFLALFFWAQI